MGKAPRRRASARTRSAAPHTRSSSALPAKFKSTRTAAVPLAERGPGLDAGLDFSAHLRQLCVALVAGLPELAHVDLERVGIGCVQVRRGTRHGILATTTPLRFAGGATVIERRGAMWRVPDVVDSAGRQVLYLLKFFLPRFCDYPFEEKLTTVIHELWHIGTNCDGDLRRHAGRNHAHGPSKAAYDDQMRTLMRRWLARQPEAGCTEFLRHDFRQLLALHARVVGEVLPTPRLIRVAASQASSHSPPVA